MVTSDFLQSGDELLESVKVGQVCSGHLHWVALECFSICRRGELERFSRGFEVQPTCSQVSSEAKGAEPGACVDPTLVVFGEAFYHHHTEIFRLEVEFHGGEVRLVCAIPSVNVGNLGGRGCFAGSDHLGLGTRPIMFGNSVLFCSVLYLRSFYIHCDCFSRSVFIGLSPLDGACT